MFACVCPAPGLLLLEISDQKEASRDISPTYISEKEGWANKKEREGKKSYHFACSDI